MKNLIFFTLTSLISTSVFAAKFANTPCEVAANDRAHGFLDSEMGVHGNTTGLKEIVLDSEYLVTITNSEGPYRLGF